jgi:hypothetical protein
MKRIKEKILYDMHRKFNSRNHVTVYKKKKNQNNCCKAFNYKKFNYLTTQLPSETFPLKLFFLTQYFDPLIFFYIFY